MIYDTLAHIDAYRTTHPGLYKALTLIRDTDYAAMEDGKYEVEGKDLYFMLQSYDSKPQLVSLEAHKAYADIQVVLTGKETMGYAPLEEVGEEVKAAPEKDCWHYAPPAQGAQRLVMEPGKFMILFPGDAHAPGLAYKTSAPIRKCVFKLKL